MLRTCLVLLAVTSVAMSQLIIDPAIPWGKIVIDQMVDAINKHETWAHLDVEYETITYTLGRGEKWSAYIIVHSKTDKSKRLSCTVDLHQTFHELHNRKFEVGLVICSNDPEHSTTTAAYV